MNINKREEGNYAILELEGDVDLTCSPEVRKHVLACLEAGKNLLVVLSAVTYIDSSGVASLVEGYQKAKKQDLKFGLVDVSSSAMSVFQLARLDKVFPIHESVEEILQGDG